MQVAFNTSLKSYNTFGIDVKAEKLVTVETREDLKNALQQIYASETLILGGGSNMLLTGDLAKTVLHINLKGKKILTETEDEVVVKAMAGENWHEFVLWTLENGYGGLQNLSLIPGNVGTSPIQNIGAYGVELKDVFVSCDGIDMQTLQVKTFGREACNFSYRNSIFKKELKGRFIITSVNFRLSKKNHILNTDYGAIKAALAERHISSPGIKDISDAVIRIRQQKLPDPKELGNSGSFFKNPVITEEKFKKLQEENPEIPSFLVFPGKVKIPAGWLIERAGLKGYRKGDAGVHKNQALVLVNYGQATGQEILELSREIQQTISTRYGIKLSPEVNII